MNLMFDIDSNISFEKVDELNESTGKTEKKYKIKGIFSTIGEKNRNGRIYPPEIWKSQVEEYQKEIEKGTNNCLMEFEHPARSKVDIMEAVARITKLSIDKNHVIGEAVLLDNPKANQLKSLIDNGVKLSVSSRGAGSVVDSIVRNFHLITYDIVSEPSDYNATMNGVCESYQLNEGVITDVNYELDKHGNLIEANLNESDMYAKNVQDNLADVQNHIEKKFTEFFSKL